jgi:hypothetical protein
MLPTSRNAMALVFRHLRLARRHVVYGLPGWLHDRPTARNEALATLFHVVNAHLRTLGGDYWIVYGTLLGWHREGRILPHDADVDFGAPVARYEEILSSRHRLPPGFTLHDTSHHHHGPKLYFAYRGWEADLYFFTESDGQLRSTERSQNPGETEPFPRDYFFPAQPACFLGEPTLVPAQVVPYLEHVYRYLGPDAVRDPVTRYFRPRG